MPHSNIQHIQEFLPHRYPFLLVDRIKEIDLDADGGARITALKNVTINEDFFNGHFPGHPIMPGRVNPGRPWLRPPVCLGADHAG